MHHQTEGYFMTKSERLTILSTLEEFAFYGLPDFDDDQRSTYFTFNEDELNLICRCKSFHASVYCSIQIGYFKAKHMFFRFSLSSIPQKDIDFIVSRYFEDEKLNNFIITKNEHYFVQTEICNLFHYTLWTNTYLPLMKNHAEKIARIDATPKFILQELFYLLKEQKIVRPGYTTLQTIVSESLVYERLRIKNCLQKYLTDGHKKDLQELLKNDSTLIELAALKQDAKNFRLTQMGLEVKKHQVLKSLYAISNMIIPHLSISGQNITYYASLVHHYTITDLNRFDDEKTYLYLLCYVFKRYTQVNDNIMTSFIVNTKKIENEVKEKVKAQAFSDRGDMEAQMARIMLIFVDDAYSDEITLGVPRKKAFSVLPKEIIRSQANRMLKKQVKHQENQWELRDKMTMRYKQNLRHLFMNIEFDSKIQGSPLIQAIEWMQGVFSKKKLLTKQKIKNIPISFISNRMKKYIQDTDETEKTTYLMNRYEILVYRQIIKQIETGAIHIKNSIRYRPFVDDLVNIQNKEKILKDLDIPWCNTSCEDQIDSLFKDLDTLWNTFDLRLKQGDLKHIKYNSVKKEIIWTKPREIRPVTQYSLYNKIPMHDISEVLHFVHRKTNFMSAFVPLQPRYVKHKQDYDHLIAVFMAQAANIGHYKMAQTSDIPYHKLESTYQQYMRLGTLKNAANIIANKIAQLPVFPHYTFDDGILFGSFDGQKFEALTPTVKARFSKNIIRKVVALWHILYYPIMFLL